VNGWDMSDRTRCPKCKTKFDKEHHVEMYNSVVCAVCYALWAVDNITDEELWGEDSVPRNHTPEALEQPSDSSEQGTPD